MTTKETELSENNKKAYEKPQIESEEILEAGLMAVCNGTTGGVDALKVTKQGGCSAKKT